MRALRSRLRGRDGEAGLTLVELLVAAAMSIIVVGAASSMLISAVRDQPALSKRAQNISSARWVLERITREVRNGIEVNRTTATASSVSLRTYVRRSTCGGAVSSNAKVPAIPCQVTYSCTATACSRREAGPGIESGTAVTVFKGIDSSAVFCYVPSANANPTICGPAGTTAPTYVGVTLHIPNPGGSGDLTVSDGASLRNATLSN
jgi:Tfp pilus assembly protein PilW